MKISYRIELTWWLKMFSLITTEIKMKKITILNFFEIFSFNFFAFKLSKLIKTKNNTKNLAKIWFLCHLFMRPLDGHNVGWSYGKYARDYLIFISHTFHFLT